MDDQAQTPGAGIPPAPTPSEPVGGPVSTPGGVQPSMPVTPPSMPSTPEPSVPPTPSGEVTGGQSAPPAGPTQGPGTGGM